MHIIHPQKIKHNFYQGNFVIHLQELKLVFKWIDGRRQRQTGVEVLIHILIGLFMGTLHLEETRVMERRKYSESFKV